MSVVNREVEIALPGALLSRLADARRMSDALFDIVRPDSLYERPIPERHRIVFYIGHLEAFDRNLLNGKLLSLQDPSPDLDRLFAFGIDPVGGGLPTDQPSDWPALAKVRNYVDQVRNELDEGLANLQNAVEGEFPAALLLDVAIEHRLMHAETLAYMLHRLPYDRKSAPAGAPQLTPAPVRPGMVQVPAGLATLGLSRNGDTFGWDNEFERHTVDVDAFAIDRYKTTNSEYLEFINSRGYDNRTLWSDADWAWKESNRISHPAFWRRDGNQWLWKGMFAEIPLPPDWPVYVSHAEASAYARWAGKSLPTEEQWQRAAYGAPGGQSRSYPWGSKPPNATIGNFDFENWDPVSVAAHPGGVSAFGAEDILGNGWEWTFSVFAPFAGFEPFPFYRGYSADFFDGKHYVIKGASPRTAACMLRPSFRNWFQPHYQYVYAGFRCVSNQLG
ncbi:MAG TPA: SUMF1/EgtB/PvdO family nonheme iron enzyme [Terriglobia bacterium]|nr:SUMF1/EgtB/PvdO family nonheme iron enzyme [Terriglobia bacterium]